MLLSSAFKWVPLILNGSARNTHLALFSVRDLTAAMGKSKMILFVETVGLIVHYFQCVPLFFLKFKIIKHNGLILSIK